MPDFKLVCAQCHSDNVLEKSARKIIDCAGEKVQYSEGIQRKCLDCNNESFVIFRTGVE